MSSVHPALREHELPSSELDPVNDVHDGATDSDSDSGSYMSSSFYASDQGEDSEDESFNTTASTVILPTRPATVLQPANTLPGMPFLPLETIASFLSLDDLSALYYTHRQLKATIDEGSLAFFGRFWHQPPRSEWVNRARRIYGWYDKTAHPGHVDAMTKLGDVGMDEFWKQIKSAFWVSSFAGDRNDRAMIQQSFWSSLLSPENSPPPERAPPTFASQRSRSGTPNDPLPTSQTRILRPTLSAGYRAFAQHGYVLTGAHHLLLLQHEVCWPCLFAPEESSQGPEIHIVQTSRKRARTGFRRTLSHASSSSDSDPGFPREAKVCDGCGGSSCGRHPTSAETSRALELEISFLPPPSPVQAQILFPSSTSTREAVYAASQGTNPLQIYYRRRSPHEHGTDEVLAHFHAASGVPSSAVSRFSFGAGAGGGGGGGNWLGGGAGGAGAGGGAGGGAGTGGAGAGILNPFLFAAIGGQGGGAPPNAGVAGAGAAVGAGAALGGGPGGHGFHHHGHFGGFAAFVAGLGQGTGPQNANGPPPNWLPQLAAPGNVLPWGHINTIANGTPPAPNPAAVAVAPPAALAPAPTLVPTAQLLPAVPVAQPQPQPQPQPLAPQHTFPAPTPTTSRYYDWWVCSSCADAFGPGHAWSRRGDWD